MAAIRKRASRASKAAKRIVISLFIIVVVVECAYILYLFSYQKNPKNSEFNLTQKELQDAPLPLYKSNFILPSKDPLLITELRSNYSQMFDGSVVRLPRAVNVSINADGFRGRNYNETKSIKTKRIVVIGDSVAFGQGVEENETFSAVLEKMLNRNSSMTYEVLNMAVPGYNTEQEVEMLYKKGLKYSPDLVIVAYHLNDAYNTSLLNELQRNLSSSITGDKVNMSNATRRQLIIAAHNADEILDKKLALQYSESGWNSLYPPWERLRNLSKSGNFSVLVVSGIELYQDAYHADVSKNMLQFLREKAIGNETNWALLDVRNALQKYPRNSLVVHPLDGHANALGHSIIAGEIYRFLANESFVA